MSAVADLPRVASGKVRDLYDLGDDRLLLVASDRVSTYDVVHPTPVPGKGAVLTGLSAFWFGRTGDLVPNHLVSATEGVPADLRGRALVVRRLEMVPVECVVRGYLAGSGWRDYEATGAIAGIPLPSGLREGDRLPEPIFTPATKAAEGDHDETIDLDAAAGLAGGRATIERLRAISIALYERAAEHARTHAGILLADTKFEFGREAGGELVLGDEVLTSDSSRFWPADQHTPGRPQPSFDKQFVRDWATSTGWDRRPPAPPLPDELVARTRERYERAYELLTGEPLAAWMERTRA